MNGNINEIIALSELNIRLENEIQSSIEVKTQLENYITSQKMEINEYYQIEKKLFVHKTVLFKKENIELEHLGISVGELHELARQKGLIIAGAHYVRYENIYSEYGDFTMETCLPVIEAETLPKECVKEEKNTSCLSAVHKLGFSTIGKAHQKIIEYAEQQHMKLSGKVFEVYNKDMNAEVYYELCK